MGFIFKFLVKDELVNGGRLILKASAASRLARIQKDISQTIKIHTHRGPKYIKLLHPPLCYVKPRPLWVLPDSATMAGYDHLLFGATLIINMSNRLLAERQLNGKLKQIVKRWIRKGE